MTFYIEEITDEAEDGVESTPGSGKMAEVSWPPSLPFLPVVHCLILFDQCDRMLYEKAEADDDDSVEAGAGGSQSASSKKKKKKKRGKKKKGAKAAGGESTSGPSPSPPRPPPPISLS